MATGLENRQTVYSWLNTFLRDLNLLFQKPGSKGGSNLGNHTIDEATGNWGDVSYSKGKPLRWLFQIDFRAAPVLARLPDGGDQGSVGGINTAQGQSAAVALRILPLLQTDEGAFVRADEFEVAALFIFHGPLLPAGSSSDPVNFDLGNGAMYRILEDKNDLDPQTGKPKRVRFEAPYVFAGLVGLEDRATVKPLVINGVARDATYGEVIDALHALISVNPVGAGAATPIPVYDLTDDAQADALKADIKTAWDAAGAPPAVVVANGAEPEEEVVGEIDISTLEVPENPDLLGIDPAVYRQINAALRSGKQHIMLYGPPGTGKTSLARWIASSLPGGDWTLVTGSSDWSSQDIIGGYQPVGDGNVDFVPGILLRDFDRPLIIDEMNRCDIDKVIGPLFTVLSGQQTTLPYRTDIKDKKSAPYAILPRPKASPAEHEFAPGHAWRLIATINSIDKASLYQMSYALARRFGWVYVDAPLDLSGFITDFLGTLGVAPGPAGASVPLADLWTAINRARVIGPAPIIDAIKAIREIAPASSFFGPPDAEMQGAILDAIDMVLLPMLDGIVLQDAINITDAAIAAFNLTGANADRVKRRLETVAI